MQSDMQQLHVHVSGVLDQMFKTISGAGGVVQLPPQEALRRENAVLKKQLALLRETDDAELDALHDYCGSLHLRLAELERGYAAMENSRQDASQQALTSQQPAAGLSGSEGPHQQLAVVPAEDRAIMETPGLEGQVNEMTTLLNKVAPSLQRLPDLEAQLQELASFKAEMRAEMQATAQAVQQTQAQASWEGTRNQVEQLNKEVASLTEAVLKQQDAGKGKEKSKHKLPEVPEKPSRKRRLSPELPSAAGISAKHPAGEARMFSRPSGCGKVGPSERPCTSSQPKQADSHPPGLSEAAKATAALTNLKRQQPFYESKRVLQDQINDNWLSFKWRCSICCKGFGCRKSLAQHFMGKEHNEFSSCIYEFLTGRSIVDDKRFPAGVKAPDPCPAHNRSACQVFRGHVSDKMWHCQICNTGLGGLQFLVHQRSSKHKAAVGAVLH